MAVQIRVDQTGAPAGVPGQAREDLVLGTAVSLTAVDGPFFAYAWRIIDKPIDITLPARSAAALSNAQAQATTLSPIDKPGTYLVEVAVDSGRGLGAGVDDVARITFYAGPSLSSDPLRLPRRVPAAFESTEHNAPDLLDPYGNPEGWAREWRRWFALIAELTNARDWASGVVSCPSGGPATLVRGHNVAGVLRMGPGYVNVFFASQMPDTNYGVIGSCEPPTFGIDANIFHYTAKLRTGFTVYLFNPDSGAPFDSNFTFAVKLGA